MNDRRNVIGWVLLALAGLVVAVALSLAASRLSTQEIGLTDQPLNASGDLAPRSSVTTREATTRTERTRSRRRRTTTQTTPTTAAQPAPTTTETVTEAGDDSSGRGRGRGRGRGGSGSGGGDDD